MIKSVHLNSDGSTNVVNSEFPTLEAGAILIRTSYSEVCGTDVHLQDSKLAGVPYPIIPGHVSTGTIEDVNGDVNDIDGVKINFIEEWVHLRKSNTEPIIRIYSESKSKDKADSLAKKIIEEIKELI